MATTTAAQRREESRVAYNAYLKDCPTNALLARISDKWVGLVMTALAENHHRYSDLGRRIPGISQKMLTQTLRTLERDGLVTRAVTPSVPVRVDYTLTPLGENLARLFAAVKDWAEQNINKVFEAREHYDARAIPGQEK